MTGALTEDDRAFVEQAINRRVDELEGWPGAFGFGHGVDVFGLLCAWVERELIPHERRLNAKIVYDIRLQPGGARPRVLITALTPLPPAAGPPVKGE